MGAQASLLYGEQRHALVVRSGSLVAYIAQLLRGRVGKGSAATFALLLVLKLWNDNAKARRRKLRAAKEKAGAGGEDKPRKKRANPMMEIFYRLWPFGSRQDDTMGPSGRLELFAIFAVSVLRTWHQNRMVYVKRDLMSATYTRNRDLFKRVMIETAGMSVVSSLIFATHRFLKERLSLLWREKITRQLHQKYFSNMNYYKLSHLNKSEVDDIEERIVKDPRRFCKALADEMEKLSGAATSGIWFTYKLMTIASLPYAFSPIGYFSVAYLLSTLFAPNWSAKWRKMLDLRAKYFGTHTRLQAHAEAICAYQGNDIERGIIDQSWQDFLQFCVGYVKDATFFEFIARLLFEYGGHSFAQSLIISRFMWPTEEKKILSDSLYKDAQSSAAAVSASASLFADVRFNTEYFIRAMTSQGLVIQVMRQLQQMRGPASRLTQLYDTLDRFSAQREISTTFIDKPSTIGFNHVDVYTPTGVLLIKDLHFEIQQGTNLLLTGCNGSGKSSIFRCLGGLWEVPGDGTITKPGGASPGLNDAVFYLPQKPYNVLGTLRDQLCYPAPKETARNISPDLLLELLTAVDLAYLIERGPQGPNDDKEVNWETTLSMGEKQRLAMARLFFHAPAYAILDECTSGVSAAMERRMYETCEARGITCITISHRPVLEQFHDVVLNVLKDGKGGWEIRKTARGQANKSTIGGNSNSNSNSSNSNAQSLSAAAAAAAQADAAASSSSPAAGYTEVGGVSRAYLEEEKGDALLEKARLERRSKPYKELWAAQSARAAGEEGLPVVPTFQRLKDVLRRGFMPRGMSLYDPEARRIVFLCAMVVGKTLAANAIALYDGYMLSIVLKSDWKLFMKVATQGAAFRSVLALFDAATSRQKWYLNLKWRERLTRYLMDLYFTHGTFYDVANQDDRIADVHERITEQVETLSISLTDLWTNLLRPTFDISFNLVVLLRVVGVKAVSVVGGYMTLSALILRFVVPNFRANIRKQYMLEGRFRFVHTRLRDHTESVAFFGGDEVEHEVASNRFAQLRDHISTSHLQSYRFNIFNNFTIKQTPDLMAFALRMFVALSLDDNAVLLGGGGLAARGEYIQQTVMRTFKSFGDAFELQETIGNFIGTLVNVTDTMYVLEDLAARNRSKVTGKTASLVPSEDGGIRFEDVDIVAPGGTCCVGSLSFSVQQGKPLVVTGPNGCGKSSLFRVLGGLWPIPHGRVWRPVDPATGVVTPQQVFLVPQKPYSVRGSLADQITYPGKIPAHQRTEEEERRLMAMLELVQIAYLVPRYATDDKSGWDAQMKWEDVLSLGEQQRMGCARLFWHSPTFAILDECTSAVSIDVERALYAQAAKQSITSITLSQRLALEEFHEQELRLGDANGDDGWAVRDLH